ncbi:MAG: DNA-binding transcriptional regulator [Opitutaceae bacterium]|nr:DNA-binding transcriptional regulator [Opitutaceae bacterium]
MKHPPKVALLIETSNSYARALLQGVRAWVREHGPWSIRLTEQGRGAALPAWLHGWDGDGVIARVENTAIARGLRATGLPVIDVSAALPRLAFPRVATDAESAAQLAARHLIERGLTRFAYCGDRRFHWARRRGEAFARATREVGGRCPLFSPTPGAVDDEVGEIARWLRTLPRPVGVLACLDLRGQQVLAACRLAGLHVPDEVAVIGVHNDELLCELCDPPLSSVIPNAQRAGYEAAALLARAMAGKRLPLALHEIAPLGVEARQSTDLAAVGDAKIASAVRVMREQAARGANVADVLRAVPMARTALERRFKAALGTTPHAHLRKLRIERVQQLLVSTSLPVGEIAAATGFEHPEYLSAMFRRECGVGPREYRARHRAGLAASRA